MIGIKSSLKPYQGIQVQFLKSKNKNGHMTKVLGLKNGNLTINKCLKNVSKKIGNVLKS